MRQAVQAAPSDIPLRRHLAALLAEHGRLDEAVQHAAAALHAGPADELSRDLMRQLLGVAAPAPAGSSDAADDRSERAENADKGVASNASRSRARQNASLPPGRTMAPRPHAAPTRHPVARTYASDGMERARSAPTAPTPTVPAPVTKAWGAATEPDTTDLGPAAAIVQAQEATRVSDRFEGYEPTPEALTAPPTLPTEGPAAQAAPDAAVDGHTPERAEEFVPDARWALGDPTGAGPAALLRKGSAGGSDVERSGLAWDVEQVHVTLADVGGMGSAKERLEAVMLAPVRYPELRRLYRQSLTGGVLLYGPPGCGKTFLARAVAGELGARFVDVRVRDIVEPAAHADSGDLDKVLDAAHEQAPVVVLLEDIDVLSRRRDTNLHAERAIDRIERELDRGGLADAGVYLLATTCAPWDVHEELRREGRLSRSLLVMPPDQRAREVILRQELARVGRAGSGDTPVDIPLTELSLLTDGYSCTDLEWLCTLGASAAAKMGLPLSEARLRTIVPRIPPSTETWMREAARAARDSPHDSLYTGLREYLRARRRL